MGDHEPVSVKGVIAIERSLGQVKTIDGVEALGIVFNHLMDLKCHEPVGALKHFERVGKLLDKKRKELIGI